MYAYHNKNRGLRRFDHPWFLCHSTFANQRIRGKNCSSSRADISPHFRWSTVGIRWMVIAVTKANKTAFSGVLSKIYAYMRLEKRFLKICTVLRWYKWWLYSFLRTLTFQKMMLTQNWLFDRKKDFWGAVSPLKIRKATVSVGADLWEITQKKSGRSFHSRGPAEGNTIHARCWNLRLWDSCLSSNIRKLDRSFL